MTLARLSAIIVLSQHLLQATLAQQLVLGNNPSEIDNIPKAPLNCDTRGNTGASPTKSNKSNNLFLKLQQPALSPQQFWNVKLQQPTIYQTLQQPVSNQNLPMQSQFQSIPLNLQNRILQQQDNQVSNTQHNQPQQQGPVATISNSLIGRKSSSSLRVTGVSLAPLPVNFGHSRNLLSQTSHGVQLSNLAFPSNFPYFATKSSDCVNTVDQIPVDIQRTNHGPVSNIPISVVEKIQCPVNVPIPISTSPSSTDSANSKAPIGLTLSMVPTSALSRKVESQSIQSIDLTPKTASTAYQSPINRVILTQSQPFELIQMVQPIKYQDASQTPETVESQLSSNQIQLVNGQSIQPQRQISTPFDINQNQYSDTLPINYPAPFVMQNNHGPKSSTMKILLPLLIDLLKERNGKSQYPHNCNCGCMKDNVRNSVNNNDTQIPPPEVIEGYANQRKYVSEELPMSSNIIPKDPKDPEKMKLKNNRKNYSEEEEDDDEYEDEYEDVD